MIVPPIFQLCEKDSEVCRLLKNKQGLRVYPFGHAQQKGFKLEKPYMIWQTVSGSLENKLEGGAPCSNFVETQIDVYSDCFASVRNVVSAIENAINNECYITSYASENFEEDTQLYRSTFAASWVLKKS